MKKIMVAIPTLNTIPIEFFLSVIGIQIPEDVQMEISVTANALIYESRNQFAMKALKQKYDYILWLDSDMTFKPDVLKRLLDDAEQNDLDFVCGLYFKRRLPTAPVIYKSVEWEQDPTLGVKHSSEVYTDYPKDSLFEIAAAGLGCCLTKTSVIEKCAEHYMLSPFEPMPFLGEDLAFCWKLRNLGVKLWCDSRVKCGHVGTYVFDEKVYEDTKHGNNNV